MLRPIYPNKGYSGFSLLEVIFAFAVIAIGIFAAIALFPTLFKLNESGWSMITATSIAEQQMDLILKQGVPIDTNPVTDKPPQLNTCTRSWWGAPDPSANAHIQEIFVKVNWIDEGRPRNVQLTSLLFQ